MSPFELSIPDLLRAGGVVLDNMETEAELQAALLPYYKPDDIAAARKLHADLDKAASAKVDRYGQQKGATAALRADREAFHDDVYTQHLALLRVWFKRDPEVRGRLGLDDAREAAFADWARQAHVLYDNLLDDEGLVAEVAAKGLPEADLTAALATLVALEKGDSGQEDRKGIAQQSTRARDALARTFAEWLADFRDVAEVALAGQPEWLERLGFLHRTEEV